MLKTLGLLTAAAIAAATLTATTTHAATTAQQIQSLRSGIQWERARAWHWQHVAGIRRSPTIHGAALPHSLGYLKWIERKWERRRVYAYKIAHQPRPVYRTLSSGGTEPSWWLQQAACIRSHEGAWTSNTGNGYYGAYQFLLSTWQSVGGRGYPNEATPSEQTYRAWRVWKRDGGSWREWSTAGICGLR